MPKFPLAITLTLGLTVPVWAFASGAQAFPLAPVEVNETAALDPTALSGAEEKEKPSLSKGGNVSVGKRKLDPQEKLARAVAKTEPDGGEEAALDKVVTDLTAHEEQKSAAVTAPAEAPGADKAPRKPLVSIPAFLDFIPYVTTEKDVQGTYGEKARYYDDERLGKRHIITGEDFDLDVQSLLVSYTVDGVVSDLYVRLPAAKRTELMERLKTMTSIMDPRGIWVREMGRDFWVTKTAVLSVSREKKDGNFSVEYGAAARKALETRAWLEAAPEARCPHFSGLLVGWSTLDDVKARFSSVKDCDMGAPIKLSDGSTTYTLKGVCFGIPGEVKSYLWFGADTGRLTRIEIQSEGDPIGFESVLPALKKRFRAVDEQGLFETQHAPARNVWTPRIRFDPAGKLEFVVETDGVRRAELDYDALVIQEKAREAQAKRVDSLFD